VYVIDIRISFEFIFVVNHIYVTEMIVYTVIEEGDLKYVCT